MTLEQVRLFSVADAVERLHAMEDAITVARIGAAEKKGYTSAMRSLREQRDALEREA